MSEDLNKLREITGYALERGLTVGETEGRWTEFYRVFTPYLAHDLIARLQAAEERAEKLEGALRPFFDLAKTVTTPASGSPPWWQESQDWTVVFSFAGCSVTLGDIRRAAALVNGEGGE